MKLLCDSACDLTMQQLTDLSTDILHIEVIVGDKQFKDNLTLTPVDLYPKMRDGIHVKTSQISVGDFTEKFEGYAKAGGQYLYLAFSSGLSGTYNSACLAKEQVLEDYPDLDLTIYDTKAASVGYGLIVYKTAQKIKEGHDFEYIKNYSKYLIDHVEHVFTVDNLEYLYRGGRVSRSQAIIGNALNLKPVLDVEDGKLIPIDKVRGRKKVLRKMVELVGDRGINLENQLIGINHGDDIEGAKALETMLEEKYGCTNFLTNMMGCAIGAHAGPGTLSIFFLNDDEENFMK